MTNEATEKKIAERKDKTHLDHFADILIKEFNEESDRAVVILSAALLDKTLLDILKTYLLPTGTDRDSLLDDIYAPLSSFSARIDITHRLGLISTKFCRDLHIVRRIRNNFAHKISGCSFEDSGTKDQIEELMRSSGMKKRNPELMNRVYSVRKGTRSDFFVTVLWMYYSLYKKLEEIEQVKPANLEVGYSMSDKN